MGCFPKASHPLFCLRLSFGYRSVFIFANVGAMRLPGSWFWRFCFHCRFVAGHGIGESMLYGDPAPHDGSSVDQLDGAPEVWRIDVFAQDCLWYRLGSDEYYISTNPIYICHVRLPSSIPSPFLSRLSRFRLMLFNVRFYHVCC
jgi:hypothetical protein